ncbi:hypothetical protein EJ03DRAFT_324684 [Teratosphaeria nubilosa]|uniref:Uncharacterized protein n=1 Tax=Teratosphaeria nubilosa TaxID=161662 RepID=A0A6G1LHC3_9PEZI|nr:hypothetical protein EJ03DRAFT_324684 [Teratosphaeria nubilosa]
MAGRFSEVCLALLLLIAKAFNLPSCTPRLPFFCDAQTLLVYTRAEVYSRRRLAAEH